MTSGIYFIKHDDSGKVYVGKSKDIETRLRKHKEKLGRPKSKGVNVHLWNAVNLYGIDKFSTGVLEFLPVDDKILAERELYWIDTLNACSREFGFNLRRDSSTGVVVHEETRKLLSLLCSGELNGNYGNAMSEETKQLMSLKAKANHAAGIYKSDETLAKYSQASKQNWSNPVVREKIITSMLARPKKHKYVQYSAIGALVKCWNSINDILDSNPEYKISDLYAGFNGGTNTYKGFIWRYIPTNQEIPHAVIPLDKRNSPTALIGRAIQRTRNGMQPTLKCAKEKGLKLGLSEQYMELLEQSYFEKFLKDFKTP